MFREILSSSGYCCQFDMDHFQKHTDDATMFISGIRTSEALDFVVDGQKVSHDGTVTAGFVLLYLFDPQDSISLLDSSIRISPSAYFDVNIDVWAIDSSDYVKELSVKSRKCILETDAIYGTGFYYGCISANIVSRLVDNCQCLPFNYNADQLKVEDIYTSCSWDRLICVYSTLNKVFGNMKNVIGGSECYQRCDFIQYDTDVKYVRQERKFNDVDGNHSRISVHFSDNTCLKYRREVLYTWDQMLANLGGIFGLCLGGSIISIIELVWFLFDILYATLTYRRNKTKVEVLQKKWQTSVDNLSPLKKKHVLGKYKFVN
ncbi:uncharacterized protein LOC131842815 [Achroia grisella]|uniref:uncharacterized protein LOC131842815 n=1 Tax=Achroia grisella TaxID=688607 RepID=UPI0027D2F83A|nr:uncharacterized protein LOC131842815 [Achroia grisella]